ncbi:MAG: hypothetical protein R2865_08475 [Deinococcales bacterium]
MPALWRHQLLPRFQGLWHPQLKQVVILMIPFAFSSSGRQILNVVTNNILTQISVGSVTAFLMLTCFLV